MALPCGCWTLVGTTLWLHALRAGSSTQLVHGTTDGPRVFAKSRNTNTKAV